MWYSGLLGLHFNIGKVIILLDVHYPLFDQLQHCQKAYYNIDPLLFANFGEFTEA